MDLEPRLLRYFIAVAEERHFGRAAQRLHISQPPLSQAIQQLELKLGVKLLERTSRSVELTSAGKLMYTEAQVLLRQGEEVKLLIQRVHAGITGRLRIGFVPSMLYRRLPELLITLRHEMSDVELILKELNSFEQINAVRLGELDVGFIHASMLPEGVQGKHIMQERFVVCLPQDHFLATQANIRLSDLSNDDFIFFASGVSPVYYETVLSLCVHAGFLPSIRHEVKHWLSVVVLVSQGLGVSIVPYSLSHSGLKGVVFIDFDHVHQSISQMIWPSHPPVHTSELLAIVDRVMADPRLSTAHM